MLLTSEPSSQNPVSEFIFVFNIDVHFLLHFWSPVASYLRLLPFLSLAASCPFLFPCLIISSLALLLPIQFPWEQKQLSPLAQTFLHFLWPKCSVYLLCKMSQNLYRAWLHFSLHLVSSHSFGLYLYLESLQLEDLSAKELGPCGLCRVAPSPVAPTTIEPISDALLEFGSAVLLFPAIWSMLGLCQRLSGFSISTLGCGAWNPRVPRICFPAVFVLSLSTLSGLGGPLSLLSGLSHLIPVKNRHQGEVYATFQNQFWQETRAKMAREETLWGW